MKNVQSKEVLICRHCSEADIQCDFRRQLNLMTTPKFYLPIVFKKKKFASYFEFQIPVLLISLTV